MYGLQQGSYKWIFDWKSNSTFCAGPSLIFSFLGSKIHSCGNRIDLDLQFCRAAGASPIHDFASPKKLGVCIQPQIEIFLKSSASRISFDSEHSESGQKKEYLYYCETLFAVAAANAATSWHLIQYPVPKPLSRRESLFEIQE